MTELEGPSEPEPAMQTRCVHCLREQYALAVLAVSLGEGVCTWCHQPSRPMTQAEYREALLRAWLEKGTPE